MSAAQAAADRATTVRSAGLCAGARSDWETKDGTAIDPRGARRRGLFTRSAGAVDFEEPLYLGPVLQHGFLAELRRQQTPQHRDGAGILLPHEHVQRRRQQEVLGVQLP